MYKQARLAAGDRVAFTFRGDTTPATAQVTKVRETRDKTDSGDIVTTVHYDVTESETVNIGTSSSSASPDGAPPTIGTGGGGGSEDSIGTASFEGAGNGLGSRTTRGAGHLRTERWIPRQMLTRAPKSAEEIALADSEVRPKAKARR